MYYEQVYERFIVENENNEVMDQIDKRKNRKKSKKQPKRKTYYLRKKRC